MYIASQDELAAFVQRSKNSDVLAIDTEFLREKTYYPKLCLLQMATRDESVIIDPFAVDDLRIVCELFEDENIVKIFHAGHQDLEIRWIRSLIGLHVHSLILSFNTRLMTSFTFRRCMTRCEKTF